jgi:chromosomal replication initiator protein
MSAGAASEREFARKDSSGVDAASLKEAAGMWDRVRRRLKAELGDDIYSSWFARVEFEGISAGVVRLSVPTVFLKGWIKSHYGERLLDLWHEEDAGIRRVDVTRRTALRIVPEEAPSVAPIKPAPAPAVEAGGDRFAGSPLDPRLTFATFCEGRSNDVAYRAARAVAAAPEGSAPPYNPLYIHAGVGLGKTHLLQAIAHEARALDPTRRARYMTIERFIVQFVGSLRDRSALDFKEALRSTDILALDDMQFLTGKAVQQEFCHMLNQLLDSGKQVVVAADRPPAELEGVDERVRSRMKGGVVVGMAPPDLAMRRKILEGRLAAACERNPSLVIPDAVLDYVAQSVASNGRDLDGALNRLICRAEFSDAPLTMEIAEMAIADLVGAREPRRIRIEDIQKVVASHYNVSKQDLLSARRTRAIVRPRQIAMYLAKTMTPRSFPEIGKRFGGRDHTTVLHAVRKVEELAAADEALAQEIELLKRLIQD